MENSLQKTVSGASADYSGKVRSVIQTVTGGALGIVFCLYAIGFVIINSFLGKYGVRAGAVFTFDYVAAALCYIIFVGCVAGPVWIMYYGAIRAHAVQSLGRWFWATVIVWNALITIFRQLYFPETQILPLWSRIQTIIVLIAIGHLILYLIARKRKKRWAERLLPILSSELFVPLYLALVGVVGIIGEENASGWFISGAFLLFSSLTILAGTSTPIWDLKEHLSRWEIQGLLCILFVCVVLVNAGQFGKTQYALLPTVVGGGRPTTISIKTQLATDENAKALRLPVENGLIGPVLLLYQSSSEVCVVSKDDYEKASGGAVLLRRDLIDWMATSHVEKKAKASPLPTPREPRNPAPTTTPNPAPKSDSAGSPSVSPTEAATPN